MAANTGKRLHSTSAGHKPGVAHVKSRTASTRSSEHGNSTNPDRAGSSGSGDSVRSAGKLLIEQNDSTVGVQVLVSQAGKTSMGKPPAPNRSLSSGGKLRGSGSALARKAPTANECSQPFGADEPQLVIDRVHEESVRAELVQALASVPSFQPGSDPEAFHGRAFCIDGGTCAPPKVVWKSDKKPRENSPDWLTATEYADTPEVLAAKVKFLASLLRASHRTLAYTGAGLSVAAGIGMAAVGSSGGAGTGMGARTAAEPTISHCVMAELNRQKLLHGWVQQNHDGLPQKAGYRQEDINEVHGSWFDPSNPVVKYSGTLRDDLFGDMENQACTADLVLVLGTSLTGLNADQCVTSTAERSLNGTALGSVIISPQRTAQDGEAALRIFAKADDVMVALAREFGFGPRALGRGRGIKCSADLYPKEQRVLVPYDRYGRRSHRVKTHWDLSPGQQVCFSAHNNLKGARQPHDKGLSSETVGTVKGRDNKSCSIDLNFNGVTKKLGLWWLETAKRGGVEFLPIINVDAREIESGGL